MIGEVESKNNRKFKAIPYQNSCAGEVVIKSSPSTGLSCLFNCDFFYLKDLTEKSKIKGRPHHPVKSYEDPWIVLKSIPDARIVNKQLIVTNENKILYGLQYHYLTQPNLKKIENDFEVDYKICFDSKKPITYPVAVESESFEEAFFLGETDNFGHWLFEFLPKLLWYKKYLLEFGINVPIIVGEDVPKRWLVVGEPLGIPAENFQRVKLGKTLKVKRLFICGPSVGRTIEKLGLLRVADICELRVLFRNYYKLDLIPQNVDILFESREKARWRKIINEDSIIHIVKNKLGLKTEKFFPEKMTFKEQIEKLQSSKIFVGTGASLPFSFFMSKDSVLVEVRYPTGAGFATCIASDIFRIPWYRPKTTVGDSNSGPTTIDADLHIDENNFLKSIDYIVKNYIVKNFGPTSS